MKKFFVTIFLIIIFYVTQTSIFHHLALNGIIPDLMLILVCAYGFLRGETEGVVVGFFCGLLIDAFNANYLGFHSLIYMYIGFFNGMLNRLYIDDRIKLPIICIGLSDLLSSLTTYCLQFLLNKNFHFAQYFLNIILPEFLYTVLVSVLLYPLVLTIEDKIVLSSFAKEEDNAI